ncbi:phytanoyl-CoA dioxygenase family protein [Variovorax sp. OV329]|uniref:phytanoyl-CoA dioxygenase family protein n=1 Tax=Variovorax sp. OV329 TaxID=1882825 RepID=UPI0008E788F7|nr:phytanoyl-CoA dioxygenase family protein [Variovorax sp. OV329]SFM32934.1 Ectoine hydroxylase-related dioxygenase, phytanoyl-CoA dioxygenase (PhyH) family [Variovorax sp. OV329]
MPRPARYSSAQHDAFAQAFDRDSLVVLRDHLPLEKLAAWREAFEPLLAAQIAREKDDPNRGAQRFYVSLPFAAPFCDPDFFEDEDILAIVERVAGPQPVMCQLASDTPLKGSDYQAWHADTPALFPGVHGNDTPSFQLAVNFPLCDVTDDNGPFETTLGTHRMDRHDAMEGLANGSIAQHRYKMKLGDVMIRDVRAIHRGTPNRTDEPRPMVVIGYSRRWLFRPEVSIRVPASQWQQLSPRAQQLLRFNPVVPDEQAANGDVESYRAFAF